MSNSIAKALKEITSFFKTLEGLISLLPLVAVVADTLGNFIPLISDAKPGFYLLSIIFILLAFLWQVSRYISTKSGDPDHQAMMKRAGVHIVAFVAFVILFFFLGPLTKHITHISWLAANLHLLFALWLALSVCWLTNAFIVLALRIYIEHAR